MEKSDRSRTHRAIKDIVISRLCHRQGNVGGIAGGDIGLSHEESGPYFSIEQWFKPLLLLIVVAILGENFHVASVGGSAITGLDDTM